MNEMPPEALEQVAAYFQVLAEPTRLRILNLLRGGEKNVGELAMEWGTRYYDMVRLGRYDDLSYDGRNFSEDKIFLPLPQNQVDLLPTLTAE